MSNLAVAEYVSAIFVGVCLFGLIRKLNGPRGSNWIKYSLVAAFCLLIIDGSAYTFSGPQYPVAFRYIINLLSYSIGGIVIIFATMYAACYIRDRANVKKWIFAIPIILSAVLLIANICLFIAGRMVVFENGVITEVNDYPHWLRQLQVIALMVVPVVALVKCKKLGPKAVILLIFYYVSPIIAVIIGTFIEADFTIVLGSVSLVLFASVLLRDQMIEHEVERSATDNIRENMNRVFALEDTFESLYDIDIETGHYEEFAKGDFYRNLVSDRLVTPTDFFVDVVKNIESLIFQEDKEGLVSLLNREAMIKVLEDKDHFDYLYRISSENGPEWFRMRIAYKDSDKKHFIIGVFYAANDMEAKQLAQQKLRYDTIHDIIHSGKWSFFVNANDEIIKKEDTEVVQKIINYDLSDDVNAWIDIVHPEDKESALAAFNATIADHTCKTPYDVTYRMIDRDGDYRWYHSAGRIIRYENGNGEFFGIHIDITTQMEEQKRRILGAVPLASDIVTKANIGMWAFELDEGKPPRMYVDDAMLGLLGLDHQISPEETYHAWFDNVDEGSIDLVNDAVAKMSSGEHAEVQYPWHHPNGHTRVVRCGGVSNPEYKKGIRVEGTHQDVTQMLHYDEEERERAKRLQDELIMQQFRADLLAYLSENEPDLDAAFRFFGERIIEIYHCDQIRFRGMDGHTIYLSAPGINIVPRDICSQCKFTHIDNKVYGNGGIVVMNDCSKGCHGILPLSDCPAKSSLMQRIYTGGKLVGLFSVYYFNESHTFSENGIDAMKTVATYFGLLLGRINEMKAEIARIQAESSNKAKTEFLFNMSHDIRTPMNAIIGYTDKAIKHKAEADVLDESLKTVKTSSEYLLRIVNDILDMAKIESGKLELKEDLHCGTGERNPIIEMFRVEADKKGVLLKASYDIKDRYIWFDQSRAQQIAANLISNAIKYTKPGGEVSYSLVQIPCDKEGYGRYVLSVKDTGCGMSQEFIEKIFDPFERDQSAIRSGMQGTGLGMAIVKRLSDALGGTVDIQSELGAGTTVTFTADFRLATQEEIDAYEESKKKAAEVFASDISGKKVLLVEDNALNMDIATDILTDEELVVETAGDGSVAVQILKDKGPDYYDFVLMDIQMPVMDGYAATKAIREMYPDSKLPIIALSANAFEEDKAASIAAGMNDHVAKPIDTKELFEALARCMQPG